jgi:hypothetical protein
MLCRHVYHAAIGKRRAAWRRRGVSVHSSQQTAELPGSKEEMPDEAAVYRQVLPDVVVRSEHA